jgi:hypothetical protein
MKTLIIAIALLAMTSMAQAQVSLYGPQGQYLGNLSTNPIDPNSTSNPVGRYGSPVSPDSINNPVGRWGSPVSPDSVNNPLAISPPRIIQQRRY